MDNSANLPTLTDNDTLYDIKAYSEAMRDALAGTWIKLTLTTPWAEYTGGGGYKGGLWVRKNGDNLQVYGMVKSGAVGSSIADFSALPSALLPTYNQLQPCIANSAATAATVQYDPTVKALKYASGPAAPSYTQFNMLLPLH